MPSLLDRTKGYAAFAVRRALGRSPDARIDELEREVRELKRTLAHQLRLFNGLSLNNFGTLVNLDHRQRMHFVSRDESVVLSKVEGMPYVVDFGVNPEVLPAGCENAVVGIVDCAHNEADVVGCGHRIEFHSGDYVAARLTSPDQVGNVAVELRWCAPFGADPIGVGFWTPPGPPIKWAKISVGDACAGDCQTYVTPLWEDIEG